MVTLQGCNERADAIVAEICENIELRTGQKTEMIPL